MQMECTGRQTTISKKLRKMAEEGSAGIGKILGSAVRSHVVLTSEKHRYIAEVEIKTRTSRLVALCESSLGMDVALREAFSKAEDQAVRYTKKRIARKRRSRTEAAPQPAPTPEMDTPLVRRTRKEVSRAGGKSVQAKRPKAASGLHIVRTTGPVALQPMTVEEAVKEAEFRDHEVFVFRDNEGHVNVLHRQQDGTMELIEAP